MFAVRENWAHGKQDLTSCHERAWPRKRPPPFLCRALLETHGKDFSPCVVKEGARQCSFTVRYATVCLLPCASTKNARQRLCRAFFSLCRALEAHDKPKFSRSDLNVCNAEAVNTDICDWRFRTKCRRYTSALFHSQRVSGFLHPHRSKHYM
jgi:hypothetical protein